VEQIVADFRSALADSAFEPKAYEAYATGLRQLLSGPPVPGIETLTQFDTLASAVLSRRLLSGGDGPAEAITLVLLDRPLDQRPVREAAVAMIREQLRPLPGATLTGLSVVGHDMERSIQRDVPGVVLLSCGLVVIYLAVHYRSIRRAATAAVPMGLSLLALAAIMRLLDQRLNAMNLVSVPLLIGMTVDYGIFVESLRPRSRGDLPHLALSCHAIVICAASTMIGFGSLLGTSVPAIRSLGLAVAIGVGAALAGAMLVQVPMALRAATGRADRAAPAHSFS
jgi:predicted RND superfamily exporter protein